MIALQTYHFGKTDEYPDGPWKGEPDKAQWIDEATGLDCLMVRNSMGTLCGYVGVPPEHPWHGKHYSQCLEACPEGDYCYGHSPESQILVHGGITFSAACQEDRAEGICHVPAPGRPHDVWWFGFDCGHYEDCSPLDHTMAAERPEWRTDGEYRDLEYVQDECADMALQLAAVSA